MQATAAMNPLWPCLLGSKEKSGRWGETRLIVWEGTGRRVSCLEVGGKEREGVEISVSMRLLSEMGTYSIFMIIAIPSGFPTEMPSLAATDEVKIIAAAMVAAMIVNVFFVCPFFISLSPLFFIPLIPNARRVPEREYL